MPFLDLSFLINKMHKQDPIKIKRDNYRKYLKTIKTYKWEAVV